MTNPLAARESCQERLRELTSNDLFLSRYALLYAMECLDLRVINDLVDAVEDAKRRVGQDRSSRIAALAAERHTPSRLS